MNRQQRRRLRPSRKRRTIAGLSFLAVASVGSGYGQLLRSPMAYASTNCTVTSSAGDDGPGTLRECVDDVQSGGGGVITFAPSVVSITLENSLPTISESTTIDGGAGVTIRGDGGSGSGFGFLNVFPSSGSFAGEELSISGLTITGFTGMIIGDGIIYNGAGGTVNITDSTISGNSGEYIVFVSTGSAPSGAELNVQDSTFSGNESGQEGGAIYAVADLNVHDSIFSENTSARDGGAIYVKQGSYSADTTISGSSFSGNQAQYGGALYLKTLTSPWTVESSTFIGNTAYDSSSSGSGGAVYSNSTAGGVITNSFIYGNSAPLGGAVYTNRPNTAIELNFTTVSGNLSTHYLGDVYAAGSTSIALQGSVINSAGDACSVQLGSTTVDDTFAVATDTSCGLTGADSVSSATVADLSLDDSASQTVNGVVQTFQMPGAESILVTGAPTGDLGTGISTDQVAADRLGRFTIGSRQFGVPPDPNPPAPAPPFPSSEPRSVQAMPRDRSAEVSWTPPQSSGSFPVSTYKAVASPGGRTCLAIAPALTCSVTGLTNGTPYTFTVSALNGSGWSGESAPSNAITPRAPQGKSMLIVGSRSADDPDRVEVKGRTQGLEGEQVSPWIRFPGQTAYSEGSGTRSVDDRGKFTWGRKTGKKIHVYFTSGETTSNRISIPAR